MAIIHMFGFKFNFDIPYMTSAEQAAFQSLVSTGQVTFFRKATCPCGKDIAKGKQYCSQKCYADQEAKDGGEEK